MFFTANFLLKENPVCCQNYIQLQLSPNRYILDERGFILTMVGDEMTIVYNKEAVKSTN